MYQIKYAYKESVQISASASLQLDAQAHINQQAQDYRAARGAARSGDVAAYGTVRIPC